MHNNSGTGKAQLYLSQTTKAFKYCINYVGGGILNQNIKFKQKK